jgi:hypothetical protein
MEGVTCLLARAGLAGAVEVDGGDLKIKGTSQASAIVQEIAGRKIEVVAHFQAQDCGSLHIQPEHWIHRDGRAYCPGCERFMGCARDQHEQPHPFGGP